MATGEVSVFPDNRTSATAATGSETMSQGPFHKVLERLGSLRITVVLFALAVFLVFAGTMAQTQMDVWDAVNKYFRCFIAKIELQVFFPPSFFPSKPQVPGWFPFPGGWLIGGLLLFNQGAASVLRFPVQARGLRRWMGALVEFLGLLAIWAVVAGGENKEGFDVSASLNWSTIWRVFLAGLGAAWLASVAAIVVQFSRTGSKRKAAFWLLVAALVGQAVVGVGLGWLALRGDEVRLGDSNMRILWQLMKATFAAVVLQVGCTMLFKKKGALVVLHFGVVLMMLGELLVGLLAVEARMSIREGETVNFVENDRKIELAVVDPSDAERDEVVVVPGTMLERGTRITHAYLPFDFEVLQYFSHSVLKDVPRADGADNPATAGIGLRQGIVAVPARGSIGTESSVDVPSAYIRVYEAGEDKPMGDFLLSRYLSTPEPIVADGKTYRVSLRAKRTYKPYSMRLIDVRKDDYVGTTTPKNYSSEVFLSDPTRGVEREVKIWMNNPLRFAGETFYQSNYHRDPGTGEELTGLAVVSNTGWMLPYVGCMVVSVGLLVHFWMILVRFVRRLSGGRVPAGDEDDPPLGPVDPIGAEGESRSTRVTMLGWVLPILAVAVGAAFIFQMVRQPESLPGEMDLAAFGELPVAYQGRVKPLDTLARNSLRIISDRETFKDNSDQTQPAIRWLADLIFRREVADGYKVFRIREPQLVYNLGLKPRRRHRYALDEFVEKLDDFAKQAAKAHAKDAEDLDRYEKKVLELEEKLGLVQTIIQVFSVPQIRVDDSEHAKEDIAAVVQNERRLQMRHPPLAIPVPAEAAAGPHSLAGDRKWQTLGMATAGNVIGGFLGEEFNPALQSMYRILGAYAEGNVEEFNSQVAEYQGYLEANPPHDYDHERVAFEAFFNRAQLFFGAWVLYIIAFLITCLGFLFWFWKKPIHSTAFWLLVLIFAVHTAALAGRVAISGRPPVTNLYSSALFIGWAGALFGLVLQAIFRAGIGNLIAALSGVSTLHIAYQLAGDGDTFKVMQAVLDTNFWLTTHVLTVAAGYAATFVAGLLGIVYIFTGVFTPALDNRFKSALYSMIYGVLAFALFFSFIGTVLGGLWADDSWGRFWGWDPKENGALIIVLWNALVLHARWGRMIDERGLAVLAVAGNIATAWSWFGVNELGVGLHSYGFTEGVLFRLGVFVLAQLVVIAIGLLPFSLWWSYRQHSELQQTA